jgi:hypothetical protein
MSSSDKWWKPSKPKPLNLAAGIQQHMMIKQWIGGIPYTPILDEFIWLVPNQKHIVIRATTIHHHD